MNMKLLVIKSCTLTVLLFCVNLVSAASNEVYPSKPVNVIVPFSPGGGTDVAIRIFAKYFEEETGQPMIVENKPGGGGLVAASLLKSKAANGYTLGVFTPGLHSSYWMNKNSTQVDPIRDFTFIASTHGSIFGLLANPQGDFNNLNDVIEFAKKHPDDLSIGSVGTGTAHHFIALEFANMAKIKVTNVQFKGEALSNTAVAGNHISLSVSSGSFIPMVEGGKLKVLALASPNRLSDHPDWPTFKEQGYDLDANVVNGFGAPKGVSNNVINSLDKIIKKITSSNKFKKDLAEIYQPVIYLSHKEYVKHQVQQNKASYDLLKKYNLLQ